MNGALWSALVTTLPAIVGALSAALWSKRQAGMARERLRIEIEERQAKLRDNAYKTATTEANKEIERTLSYISSLALEMKSIQQRIADLQNMQGLRETTIETQISLLHSELKPLMDKILEVHAMNSEVPKDLRKFQQ